MVCFRRLDTRRLGVRANGQIDKRFVFWAMEWVASQGGFRQVGQWKFCF